MGRIKKPLLIKILNFQVFLLFNNFHPNIISKKSKKEKKFEEKIDELNQETDILIDEIDKWQM